MVKSVKNRQQSEPSSADFEKAYKNVRRYFAPSPLILSPLLSELLKREIYFKWDNKLRTGSFKERGAVNFLHSLTPSERKRGVCAASAGNHALALSFYARLLKIPCTIVMPVLAPLVKVQDTQRAQANVILYGKGFDEAYTYAQNLAAESDQVFVPAFDHLLTIAGQGTAGMEIIKQLPSVDSIVVPVGGGGLISGIACAVKHRKKKVRIFGAQSEWALTERNKKTTNPTLLPPGTIADGIAVKKIGAITGPLIEKNVEKIFTVTESEIANAVMRLLEYERTVVEGAGAAGLAAVLANHIPAGCKKVVIMACGSNIDLNVLSRLIERDVGQQQRRLRLTISLPDRPGSLRITSIVIADLRANILEVTHDRSFSKIPGDVDVSFLLEVRNAAHKLEILDGLRALGITVTEQR